jgi:hypothetical protein
MLDLLLLSLLASTPPAPARLEHPPEQLRSQRAPLDEVWTKEDLAGIVASIQSEIETIRGKRFLAPVEVRLVDRETIRRRTRERFESEVRCEDLLAEERSAKLLGLIAGDLDLRGAFLDLVDEQVGWFFDPEESVFQLAEDYSIGTAQLVLVRALTRIFDEQHHALTKVSATRTQNTDSLLALQAVASGSASAVEASWRAHHGNVLSERERNTWPTALDPSALQDTPTYIWKPMVAFALRGYTFLQRSSVVSIMLQGARPEDVEHALDDLPLSTEQVLHPVKYWKKSRADLPRSIGFDLDGLPEGWKVLREDTLGELYLGMLVEPASGLELASPGLSSPYAGTHYTCEASEGWGGDRYVLLGHDGGYLLHMVTVWDAIADAQEFHAALQSLRPRLAENLALLAGEQPESERGLDIGFGSSHDEVRYTAWVGLAPEEVAAVVARLSVTIEG